MIDFQSDALQIKRKRESRPGSNVKVKVKDHVMNDDRAPKFSLKWAVSTFPFSYEIISLCLLHPLAFEQPQDIFNLICN